MGEDWLVGTGAKRRDSLADGDGIFDRITQGCVPFFLAPGESFSAERIPAAIQPDFIAIIDAWRAGVGQDEEVGKPEFVHTAVHQAEEAGHVVAVEQVELGVGGFFGVNLEQFACAARKSLGVHRLRVGQAHHAFGKPLVKGITAKEPHGGMG